MKSLGWANPKSKVVRSISHIKPYHGATEFKKVKNSINPIDFTSKHQYELIEKDDVDILDTKRRSSQPKDSHEQIRPPFGNWILRNRISGEQSDTLQFEEYARDEEIDDIVAPDIENSALNEKNEEVLPQEQQTQERDNDFPQDQAAAEVEDNCAAPKCPKPKGAPPRHRHSVKPKQSQTNAGKFSPKIPTNPVVEIEVIDIIKPSTLKSSKCPECLKWDTRMQHTWKYQEVTIFTSGVEIEDNIILKQNDLNLHLRDLIKVQEYEETEFLKLIEEEQDKTRKPIDIVDVSKKFHLKQLTKKSKMNTIFGTSSTIITIIVLVISAILLQRFCAKKYGRTRNNVTHFNRINENILFREDPTPMRQALSKGTSSVKTQSEISNETTTTTDAAEISGTPINLSSIIRTVRS